MEDAESGKVQKMPKVPGIVPTNPQNPGPLEPKPSQPPPPNPPPPAEPIARDPSTQIKHAVLADGMLFCFCEVGRAVSMDCLSLSVVIITLNEEANLARTLASVAWADEIVVVDSGSTDRTREVAESFHAKFYR